MDRPDRRSSERQWEPSFHLNFKSFWSDLAKQKWTMILSWSWSSFVKQPIIEPPQKWVSPMAPIERRDTCAHERKNFFQIKFQRRDICDRFFSPAELKIRQFPTWNGNSPSLATSPPTILPCPRWWASGNAGIGFKSWKHGEAVPGFFYEKATCLPVYHNSNYLCSQGRSYNSKKKKSHGADSKSLHWLKDCHRVASAHVRLYHLHTWMSLSSSGPTRQSQCSQK